MNYKACFSFKLNIYYKIFISICLLIIAGSCGSKKPDLKGFDVAGWRKDPYSCQNVRQALLPGFRQIRQQLIGLSHTEIIQLLGKPEGESLESSGQRIYYYFTQPGAQCQNKKALTGVPKVAIRFDVLDRVNEISFVNY